MATAIAGHFGFAPEGSGGTYAAPVAYMALTSESVQEDLLRFPLYRVSPGNDRPDDSTGLHQVKGSIEGPYHPAVSPLLLEGLLGGRTTVATGVQYRDVYRTNSASQWDDRFPLQPYSAEINRDVGSATAYAGMALQGIELGVSPNQELRLAVDFHALEATDIAPTTPVYPSAPVDPVLFTSMSLQVAGAAFADAEAFSYRASSGIEPYAGASTPDHFSGYRREAYHEHEWGMTLGFESLEHMQRFREQVEFPIRATFTTPSSHQLVVDMPRCVVTQHRANMNGRGRVLLQLLGICRYHVGSGTTADVVAAGPAGDVAYWWEPGIGRTDGWTFASGGRPMMDDGLGNWTPVASGQRRMATTGPQAGFLSYDIGRRNLYPNNALVGVTVGTPGTGFGVNTLVSGLARAITGVGTFANGIPYVEVQIAGTATANLQFIIWQSDVSSNLALSDSYTVSQWARVASGSLTGATATLQQNAYNTAATSFHVQVGSMFVTGSLGRHGHSAFFTTPVTSLPNVRGYCMLNASSGAAVNVTLQLGGMMYEKSAVVGDPILTSGAQFGTNDEVESRAVPTDAEMAQGSMTIEFWHAGPMAARTARAFLYNWQSAGNNRLFVALPIGGSSTAPTTGQVVLGSGSNPVYFMPVIGRNIIGFTWGPATGLRVWLNGAYVGSIPYVAPLGAGVVERIGNAATVGGGFGAVAREPKAVIRYRDVMPDSRMQALTVL